ncbi:hypothetical protein PENSTE_c004G01583 [Penicillium steckii]|uniref:Sulfatase-modifying factor enzyme domain-containing protein n=1 Tax=Penicillium steckii TaxID=303698 RepID=A0A1V6TM34_9EURO|nr:hypothetical protein PENSTE_c004G01583 [Penicillium steckii]
MSPSAISNVDCVDIVDIHQDNIEFSLTDELQRSLNPPKNKEPSFPTLLLYDTKGLKLFEKITYLNEYYLTNAEIEILTTHAKRIVERIPENAQLVELGSGNLRKIEILLRECERVEKRVDYYALDLSLGELQRTFSEITPESFTYVGLHGLHGTYDDALVWLQKSESSMRPTVVLSMGSSLGNFPREAAAEFLGNWSKILKPSDFLLIGLDACKNPERVYKAYNDSEGITRQFYENGLVHANAVMGYQAFKPDEWEILTGYDEREGRHQAYYSPVVDVVINDIKIRKGTKLLFEEAYKYDRKERDQLCRHSGLISQVEFGNRDNNYHLHLLSPASLDRPTRPAQYASQSTPSEQDFQSLWTAWDIATKSMIPREDLLTQPIKLRNALIFYLGHIPTFFDIHLTRALRGKPTHPKYYQQIFERGVDPDVEDPEQCHSHSEIPDEWPPLDEIIDYQERVRNRARSLLQKGTDLNRDVAEALWIGFEHEAMHLETFLYMLLQSDRTLPPVGVTLPDFVQLAQDAQKNAKPNQWFHIPKQTLQVGLDDSNKETLPRESFGWDNEKPQRTVSVHSFEAQARPITNGEYAQYLRALRLQTLPASWVCTRSEKEYPISNGMTPSNGGGSSSAPQLRLPDIAVRTMFGPVPLTLAQDWPLIASYDEFASYAKWAGCRIPTFEETRSIYMYSDKLREKAQEQTNGHSNGINGISECSTTEETSVFRDLSGCNVGFKNWHPTPVTPYGDRLAGHGEMGGVWEWTSTPLAPHKGFHSMDIYPGYTTDFFDGKHNIIQGGSWATLPRIAGRNTFINWYQHNYLYAWAGARLVRDCNP